MTQDPAPTLEDRIKGAAGNIGEAMSAMSPPQQQAPVGPMGGTTGYAPMQLPLTRYLAENGSGIDPSLLRKLGLI